MRPLLPFALPVLLACGGGSPGARGAEALAFSPDVPAWRGGCFVEGPGGKIVNGSPSHDVQTYGTPCGGAAEASGLAYLDAYDPVSGRGDVTLLPSAPGSRPIAIARNGGTGGIVPGDAGVRLDAARGRLLTLRDVGFVTGQLVLVDLATPDAEPVALGDGVRVLNYDFLPSGAVLFVGSYDPGPRRGDLLVWRGGAVATVASGISRAEFQMYRLDPGRTQATFLQGWTETGGGDLLVVDLAAPEPAPRLVDHGVSRMAWTEGGALAWAVREPGGDDTLRVLAPGGAPVTVQAAVRSWSVAGDTLVHVSGWSILSGRGDLRSYSLAGGATPLAAGVAPEFATVASPAGVTTASVQVTDLDRRAGVLTLHAPGRGALALDDRVAPRAGFWFSPSAGLVAYARDWADPSASGSASPQPGIAGEVRVARAGGAPFTAAVRGSMQRIAWDPLERWVAALAALDPAANAGTVEVRDTSTGSLVFSASRVSPSWFGFGTGGAALAAIRGWDDALQRGELVLQRSADWQAAPVVVARDVTSFLLPTGERLVYAVRGGGRDGLWLH